MILLFTLDRYQKNRRLIYSGKEQVSKNYNKREIYPLKNHFTYFKKTYLKMNLKKYLMP